MKKTTLMHILVVVMLFVAAMSLLGGCDKTEYTLVGADMFENAKEKYAAGEQVTLYYPYIATDTDYSFYIDGEIINPDYSDEKGFIISFVMPEHDVTVSYDMVNTMEYVPDEPEMLVDYYEATVATVGGDGYFELVLRANESRTQVFIDSYSGDENGETKQTYEVPLDVVDECYEAIENCNFREWNDNPDYYGITGAYYVLKFKDGAAYTRVTSEHMPENGKELMWSVGSVLNRYLAMGTLTETD